MALSTTSTIQLDRIRQLVALHDRYWKAQAQGRPRWDVVRSWLDTEWRPWTDEYVASFGSPAALSETAVADLYSSLLRMLSRAASRGVPLPNQADPMAAQLNQITNERFWQETGYKRGQRLSRTDPEDVRMMPVWIRIRQQVSREAAARDAGRDAANVLTAEPSQADLAPIEMLPVSGESPQPRRDSNFVVPILAGAFSGAYFAKKRPVAGGVLGGALGALVGAVLSRLGA